METTYKILGTDGKEYGPATLQHILDWIREGRVTAMTQLLRSDTNEWQPAFRFEELSLQAPASPPSAPASAEAGPSSPELQDIDKQVRSGGSWFYWVAALSLVNSLMAFFGGGGGFVIGLSVTQFIDALLSESGAGARVIGLGLGVLAAGVFALFGVFANKRQSWAFIVGMVFYGIDTLLTVLAEHWLGLAFHGWVLVSLFLGLRACMQAKAMSRTN